MLANSWKRWLAENKLMKIPDQELIAIAVRGGNSERDVRDALREMVENPYFQAADSWTQLLHKRHSFGLIQRELYKLDPKHNQIERRSNVSREEFLEKYYAANRPVLLTGMMDDWPAMQKWTPAYFKELCGEETVHISADRSKNPNYETNDGKHRKPIRFSDFIDMVESGDETNDYYLTARDQFFNNPNCKKLLNDIVRFPEYLKPDSDWLFMWYGPKGTYTPLHHDLMNIFMAQVRGNKRMHMVNATEMDLVYNHDGVYTYADFEKPDYDRFPKLREASVIEFELRQGEVLFVPTGWWHDVRALDTSITISMMGFVFPNEYQWVNPQQRKADAEASKADAKPAAALAVAMDESWQGWVKENISRGCDTAGIADILRKNNFTEEVIRQAMGEHYPGGIMPAELSPPLDYRQIAEIPPARLEWKPGFGMIDTPKLQLFTLEDFLSEDECNQLIEHINRDLRPSTVTIYIEGYRTSLTCDLERLNDPFIKSIDRKICAAMGIDPSFSEGIQGQKYLVGNEFKPHTDFFQPGTKEYDEHASLRGNRTWTFMIYLNETPKGGGTKFTNIDYTTYPKRGRAVIWNSLLPDGSPNRDTMHWGMPVEEGEKYIITKWFRERGKGAMFPDNES